MVNDNLPSLGILQQIADDLANRDGLAPRSFARAGGQGGSKASRRDQDREEEAMA